MSIAKMFLLSGCGLIAFTGSAWAQDEPAGEPQAAGVIVVESSATTDENGEVVIGSTQAFSFTPDGARPLQFMVSPAGFGGMGQQDQFSMLMNERVRNELELADDQWKDIQQLQSDFRDRMRETLRGGFSPDRAQEFKEALTSIRTEMTGRLNQVLLPHQQNRLEQLQRHMQLKNSEIGEAVFQGSLAEALELTEEQKEKLSERAAEIRTEMQDEIKRIQAEAREKLLKELTPEQREKLEELLGQDFDYEPARAGRATVTRERAER